MAGGSVVGFRHAQVAPAAAVSVNVTLLAESTRRVGTAWPGAGSKRASAAQGQVRGNRENFAAALHNSLNLLVSTRRIDPDFERFTAVSCDSSRMRERQVEFVNHPRALSSPPTRDGQSCDLAGGWGAPDFWICIGTQRARGARALERGQMTQVLAATTALFRDRDLFVHDGIEASPFPCFRPRSGASLRHSAGARRLGQLRDCAASLPARRAISPAFQQRPKPVPARSSSARR